MKTTGLFENLVEDKKQDEQTKTPTVFQETGNNSAQNIQTMNILSDINTKDKEGTDYESDAIEGTGDTEKHNKSISNTADGTNTNEMSRSQRDNTTEEGEKERDN
jgi:hypothetical protein